jgi:hypothetical protein
VVHDHVHEIDWPDGPVCRLGETLMAMARAGTATANVRTIATIADLIVRICSSLLLQRPMRPTACSTIPTELVDLAAGVE